MTYLRIRTNSDAAHAGLLPRKGVLLRFKVDPITGMKVAVCQWDGNSRSSTISPKFIEPMPEGATQ